MPQIRFAARLCPAMGPGHRGEVWDPKLSSTKLDTPTLRAARSWVTVQLHPKAKSERGEHTTRPFWIIVVLSVACALAIVWGKYLLERRWL
jgi:hypothetical protein